jgi:beta-N-acetylglucosaminidase
MKDVKKNKLIIKKYLYNVGRYILVLLVGGVLALSMNHILGTNDRTYDVYRSQNDLKYYSSKDAVIESIDKYIDSIAPGSCLNGMVIFEMCEKYSVDIIFVLAQGQLESGFGTAGIAAKTNSVWNVMAFDGRTASDMIAKGHGFDHPDFSVEPYLQLITTKYLVKDKTEIDLMNNFVSSTGHRYASSKTYEAQLSALYNRIKKTTNIDDNYNTYRKYKTLCGR